MVYDRVDWPASALEGDPMMLGFRTSVTSLLGAILFLSLALAALLEADDRCAFGLFTLTTGLLLCSVLLAIHRGAAGVLDRLRSVRMGLPDPLADPGDRVQADLHGSAGVSLPLQSFRRA